MQKARLLFNRPSVASLNKNVMGYKMQIIKNLFFDTNAILKFFLDESGSEVVKWLCKLETRVGLSIMIDTSIHVQQEFYNVLNRKYQNGNLTSEKAKKIKYLSDAYFKEVFRMCDNNRQPPIDKKRKMNENIIIKKYNLKPTKDIGDAKILSCVMNYLYFLGGSSKPYIVTSDKKFQKIISAENYRIIDPEKQNESEIEVLLKNVGIEQTIYAR